VYNLLQNPQYLASVNVLFILLILSFVRYPPQADSAYVIMLKVIAHNTTSKHLLLKPCLRNAATGTVVGVKS